MFVSLAKMEMTICIWNSLGRLRICILGKYEVGLTIEVIIRLNAMLHWILSYQCKYLSGLKFRFRICVVVIS